MDKKRRTELIQISLFFITLATTTMAGAEWIFARSLFFGENRINQSELLQGLTFSIPFLTILTVHEFGHYFMAQYHKIRVTLPYYLPLWFGFIGAPSIGTMGAFIRIKDPIDSRKKYFDVGIAGPLAGFVVAFFVLIYAFSNLPEPEYVYNVHPDYAQFGTEYADHVYTYEYNVARHFESYQYYRQQDSLSYLGENNNIQAWSYLEFQPYPSYESYAIGSNLLFEFFKDWLVDDPDRIPNEFEIMHYPIIFAGYLALFFTALNLLPIGQLDGGHILYGLVGYTNHKKISQILFIGFLYYAGLGMVNPFNLSSMMLTEVIYFGFLYFCFYKFTPNKRDRIMYALAIFTLQLATMFVFPTMEGYPGWLLFAFLLGRVLGIYHPPVPIDTPLDFKRRVLGWLSLAIFVISFSPRPFIIRSVQRNEVKSETPNFLSEINPSPYETLMAIPNSLPRASSEAMNSGEEIKVLVASPSGSKN